LEIGESVSGIDEDLGNLLGSLFSYFFDLYAAFSGSDNHGMRGRAIQEDGEVVFLFDVPRGGEIDGLHFAASGTCLDRDERVIEHLARNFESFVLSRAELDAAFVTIGESAFSASTGVDLGFYHCRAVGKAGERSSELVGGLSGGALWGGHTEFCEEVFSLILVYIHGKILIKSYSSEGRHSKKNFREKSSAQAQGRLRLAYALSFFRDGIARGPPRGFKED
jgi:hypothetical protein